jgi:hypothetical protein
MESRVLHCRLVRLGRAEVEKWKRGEEEREAGERERGDGNETGHIKS